VQILGKCFLNCFSVKRINRHKLFLVINACRCKVFSIQESQSNVESQVIITSVIKMEENKSRVVKTEIQKSSVCMYSLRANFEGIRSAA